MVPEDKGFRVAKANKLKGMPFSMERILKLLDANSIMLGMEQLTMKMLASPTITQVPDPCTSQHDTFQRN